MVSTNHHHRLVWHTCINYEGTCTLTHIETTLPVKHTPVHVLVIESQSFYSPNRWVPAKKALERTNGRSVPPDLRIWPSAVAWCWSMPYMLCTSLCSQSPWRQSLCIVTSGPLNTLGYRGRGRGVQSEGWYDTDIDSLIAMLEYVIAARLLVTHLIHIIPSEQIQCRTLRKKQQQYCTDHNGATV